MAIKPHRPSWRHRKTDVTCLLFEEQMLFICRTVVYKLPTELQKSKSLRSHRNGTDSSLFAFYQNLWHNMDKYLRNHKPNTFRIKKIIIITFQQGNNIIQVTCKTTAKKQQHYFGLFPSWCWVLKFWDSKTWINNQTD